MKQPEALRLAEWIEGDMTCHGDAEIAEELRRLHAVNVDLLAALTFIAGCDLNGADHVVKGYIAHVLIDKASTAIAKAKGEQK